MTRTPGVEAPRASRGLIRAVRRALRDAAEPASAEPMRAYMKSSMPFLGVKAPERRRALAPVFREHVLEDFPSWRDTALALWHGARHREERYATIGLVRHRLYDPFQSLAALPLYEELIVTGAWWDLVDGIAPYRVRDLLEAYPPRMSRTLRSWAKGRSSWKRRSAIICQLGRKERTDWKLLTDCIEPSIGSEEFFLRKAIGWALRQHAYTDPRAVVRFVRERKSELSPLSKREALRNLLKSGAIDAIPRA